MHISSGKSRFLFLLVLVVLACEISLAQAQLPPTPPDLYGTVYYSDNVPAKSVNITLQNMNTTKVAYTTTNDKGFWSYKRSTIAKTGETLSITAKDKEGNSASNQVVINLSMLEQTAPELRFSVPAPTAKPSIPQGGNGPAATSTTAAANTPAVTTATAPAPAQTIVSSTPSAESPNSSDVGNAGIKSAITPLIGGVLIGVLVIILLMIFRNKLNQR